MLSVLAVVNVVVLRLVTRRIYLSKVDKHAKIGLLILFLVIAYNYLLFLPS